MIKLFTFNKILFLMVICISILGCQDDLYEHVIKEPARTLKIERFSMKDANTIKHAELLKSTNEIAEALIVPLNTEKLSARMVYDSLLGIEYDDEKGIHIQNGDYESYTFPIRNYETNEKVKNLIFSSKTNGDFDIYIYKYDFTKEELANITEAQFLSKEIIANKIEAGRIKPPSIVCIEFQSWDPGLYPNCGPDCGTHSNGEQCQSTGQWILDSSICGWVSGATADGDSEPGDPGSNNSGNTGPGGGGTNGDGPPPSGYNGQDPTIHGNQGPIITAPVFEEGSTTVTDPCAKLKELSDATKQNVNPRLQDLLNVCTPLTNIEYAAHFESNDGPNGVATVPNNPPLLAGTTNNVAINLGPNIVAYAHSHTINGYAIFTMQDVYNLLALESQLSGTRSEFATVYVVAPGINGAPSTVYALQIESLTKFDNWMEQSILANIKYKDSHDPNNKSKTLQKASNDMFMNATRENCVLKFSEFTKNAGIKLFEASSNLSSWSQVLSTDNYTSLTKIPCN